MLEPSVGTGNFFGLMPAKVRKASQLHGVELDPLTSQIAAALYPSAKIAKATGFQDFLCSGRILRSGPSATRLSAPEAAGGR